MSGRAFLEQEVWHCTSLQFNSLLHGHVYPTFFLLFQVFDILCHFYAFIFQGAPSHMQWLQDPLPVGARVILSVTESTCPLPWR